MKIGIKVRDIDIENRTYSLFNDIINVESFVQNAKIDEKSYKNITTVLDMSQSKIRNT